MWKKFSEKNIVWNHKKNQELIKKRNISFESIQLTIEDSKNILSITPHTNKRKYPNQYILYVYLEEKVVVVPFVINKDEIFLKTAFFSRKATKIFLN